MQLSEAEIQVLASLDWAIAKGSATDRSSLEDSGRRFAEYLEDWSDAFDSLREKGLISGDVCSCIAGAIGCSQLSRGARWRLVCQTVVSFR